MEHQIVKSEITKGSRVSWTYEHHLNSSSSTRVTKEGEFIDMVHHPIKRRLSRGFQQMAIVLFDSNKNVSRVPYSQLKLITKK